ncbi:MAG: hypothetical protein HFI86_05840 [Bacilli bacterium]|nr:hypothetical protein [Bacilli bacterium]
MTEKREPFKSDKWLYYQNVKPLNIYVEPTEKDKRDVEEFRKFIDEKIKNEKDTKNQN